MRRAAQLTISLLFVAVAARAEVTGVWSGTLHAADQCNSAPAAWSSPFTLAVVPGAGEGTVRGNAFFAAVPIFDAACAVQGTFPLAVPFGGRAASDTITGSLVFRGRPLILTAVVDGSTMSLSIHNDDFTGAATLSQTSTQPPPSPLSGFYAGEYEASETVEQCTNLTSIRYSGPLTANVVQTGQFVTATGTVSNAQRLVRAAGNICSSQPVDQMTVNLSGQLNGSTLTGVVFDAGRAIPFTASIGPNGISGEASDDRGSFSFTLVRSTAAPPVISLFSASPSAITVGEMSSLTWQTENATSVVIDHGIGRRPPSGAIAVRPRASTEFTLTAIGPGGVAESTVTVAVSPRPRVVVSAFPQGFVQRAGEGGGSDRFTLSNVGEVATTVTLTPGAAFFTLDVESFNLAPGEHRVVTITGLPQPAGPHIGRVAIAGDGVLAAGVPVRMLSVTPPAGVVRARAAQRRAEISSSAGQTASGTVRFSNEGDVPLQGVAVADVPWIVPEEGMITIPPGATAEVEFTVDSSKRPDADAPVGALTGTISLVFPTGGGSGARVTTNGAAPSSTVSVSLVYVVKPGAAPGLPPPLEAGELARFAPGLPNRSNTTGDLLLANTLTTATLDQISLYLQASGATSQVTTIAGLQPNSSVALPGVVGNIFGSSVQSATVQIRGVDVDKVAAASLVTSTTADGEIYTAALPMFRSDRAAGPEAAIILSGIEQSATAATDVFVQETAGAAASYLTEFLDADGSIISARPSEAIAAFGFAQLSGVVPPGTSAVRIVNTAGGGALAAYGLVSNSATGDAWAVTDPAAGSGLDDLFVIPLLPAGPGATTLVSTTNRSGEPVDITVDVIGGGRGRRRAVQPGTTASPGQITDAASTLAPLQTATTTISGTSGWIRVAAPAAAVSASARSLLGEGAAAYGSALPVVPLSDALEVGQMRRFAGVDSTEAVATNLMLVEAAGQTAVVRVTLQFVFSGGSLTTGSAQVPRDYTLAANQALLISDVARDVIGASRDSFGELRDMLLDVEVVSGSGRVAPFVQSIDSMSGDAVVRSE